MRKSSAHLGGIAAQKLFTNSLTFPQAGLATGSLVTNSLVGHSLYQLTTQFCAQYFMVFNRLSAQLITTIHRPNNKNNKGE